MLPTRLGQCLEEMPKNIQPACRYFNQGNAQMCIDAGNNLKVLNLPIIRENSFEVEVAPFVESISRMAK
jgi:hypothetical protein